MTQLSNETLIAWKQEAEIAIQETPDDVPERGHHVAILSLVTELQEARRLLAAEAQEAVYQVQYDQDWRDVCKAAYDDHVNHGSPVRIVYAAPHPVTVPICPKCSDTGMADSGGVQPWGEPIYIHCDCRAAMLNAEPVSQPYTLPDDDKTNMLCDSAYVNGLQAGFSMGQMNQEEEYARTVELYSKGIREYRAAMHQPSSGALQLPHWIPCSERMPELDTRVLLYFADYDGHTEDGCIGDEGEGPYHYFFDGDSLRHEPTHWMPLPSAPQEPAK